MSIEREMLASLPVAEVSALIWFVVCWVGYTFYSERKAERKQCLHNTLHHHRKIWMTNMLARDNRVADAALLANLERSVSFFASTSMIIIAGTLTLLGSLDHLENLPLLDPEKQRLWGVKLLLLIAIFVYAFFKFTWSLRQYGFACVMIGSAPTKGAPGNNFDNEAAEVISRAANAYNLGLRSYYFALAFIVWFVSSWAFIGAATLVVWVLYRREFKSKVLKALIRSAEIKIPQG